MDNIISTEEANIFDQPVGGSPGFFEGSHALYFKQCRVFSAFHPIYSFAHRRKVGLEALARGIDHRGKPVPPWKLFNRLADNELFELERDLQRVHLDNFNCLDRMNTWLFLNVNPAALNDINQFEGYFRELLARSGIPAYRIVIEILEDAFSDESLLAYTIKRLKAIGCMIAIDDFGAGHSNFERVWRLEPDIVKFDHSLIQRATRDPSVQVMLKGVVDILHAKRCIVVAEGIETIREAVVAMDANVDLGQGFLFSHPFRVSDPVDRVAGLWDDLYQAYDNYAEQTRVGHLDETHRYMREFRKLVEAIEQNDDLSIDSESLLGLPRTMRLFVLSQDGAQLSANIESSPRVKNYHEKLEPLYQANGANWKLKPYFRNALNNPGEVNITSPYFSITDARLCITLSSTVRVNGELQILCCDLKSDY